MGDLLDWLGEVGDKYGFTDGGTERSGTVLSKKNSEAEINVLTGEDRRDSNGYSASGSVVEAKTKGDTTKVITGEGMVGYREDGEHWKAGAEASVGVGTREVDFVEKYDLDENLVLEADVGVGTASAGATVTDEGISVGAQANYVEGSVTVGTTGTGDRDEEARIGLSAGGGAAGRIHYGDRDGDGNPEYGVGVDYGPVSVDIKTEDPLRKALEIGAGPILGAGLDLVDGNMTNRAGEAASEAYDEASEAASDAYDAAGEAYDDASEAASEALDDAGEAYDNATEAASDAVDDASDYVSDLIWGDD